MNHSMQITHLDESPFQLIVSTYKYFSDLRTFTILPRSNFIFYILHWVLGDDFICPCPPRKKCRATSCSDLKSLEEDLVHPARHSILKENIFSPRRKNKPSKLHHDAMSHICIRIYIYMQSRLTPNKSLLMQWWQSRCTNYTYVHLSMRKCLPSTLISFSHHLLPSFHPPNVRMCHTQPLHR